VGHPKGGGNGSLSGASIIPKDGQAPVGVFDGAVEPCQTKIPQLDRVLAVVRELCARSEWGQKGSGRRTSVTFTAYRMETLVWGIQRVMAMEVYRTRRQFRKMARPRWEYSTEPWSLVCQTKIPQLDGVLAVVRELCAIGMGSKR
jgi:hypothetical protein